MSPRRRQGHRRGAQGRQLAAQPRRQQAVDAVERGERGPLDARYGGGRGHPQHDGHGHGLFVIEQERGKLGADSQAVAAARPRRRLDGVAEGPESFGVTTQRPRAHAQALRQLGAAPVRAPLQQAEQAE